MGTKCSLAGPSGRGQGVGLRDFYFRWWMKQGFVPPSVPRCEVHSDDSLVVPVSYEDPNLLHRWFKIRPQGIPLEFSKFLAGHPL